MDDIEPAETVKYASWKAADNIAAHLSRLNLNPIVSYEIKDEIDDGDQPITTMATVSAIAPPMPNHKVGHLPGDGTHIRFAMHRKYPYVFVYAKNTDGIFPAGWINVKTLLPELASAEALTKAAELALSAALAYEQVHEQQ